MRARRVSAWIAATGLSVIATGIILSPAQAGTCATWSDPGADATPAGLPAGGDPDLDITSVSVNSNAGDLSAVIKIDKLSDTGPAVQFGDEFFVRFSAGTKAVELKASRDFSPLGSGKPAAQLKVDSTVGVATAIFDVAKSAITITATAAEVAKALGSPIEGMKGSAFTALSYGNNADQLGFPLYDSDTAPTTLTTTFGSGCGGDTSAPAATGNPTPGATPGATGAPSPTPSPTGSGSPSPSTSPSAAPSTGFAGYAVPRKGCFDYSDPSTDSSISLLGLLPNPEASSSPDTEIIGVAHRTATGGVGGMLKTFIKVSALGANGPPELTAGGDSFAWNFTVLGKAVVVSADRSGGNPATNPTPAPPKATVGGVDVTAKVKPTVTYDTKNSFVILGVDLVGLGQAVGGFVTSGVQLTKISESSSWADLTGASTTADTDQGKGDAANYTVGSADPCFYPLPGKLQPEKIKATQYGHKIDVGVTFVDSDNTSVSDAVLSFSLPRQNPVTAKTDADGFATTLVPNSATAGKTTLTISFPGDDVVGKTTIAVPVQIVAAKTFLSFSSANAGSSRTVSIALRDDQRHGVAGQKVSIRSGSFSITVTTDSKGRASIKGIPPGSRVDGSYAGQSGKYLKTQNSTTA